MATRVEIEGLGIVEVDDSFLQKTLDEQNAIVADIKRQVLASQSPKTSNPLTGMKEAAQRSIAGVADFAMGIYNDLEANKEALQKKGWLGGPGSQTPDALGIGEKVAAASKLNDTEGEYRPSISFDELKSNGNFLNPLKLAQFGGERAITSIPSMAEAVFSPGTFIMGQTGNIGQDRARNNGRLEPTTGDMTAALPAAVASQALERLGAMRLFHGGPIRGVLSEGFTEAGQNPIEYAGGSVGTQAGFDPSEAASQAAEGFVTGILAGGTQRGAVDLASAGYKGAQYAKDFSAQRQVATQSPEQTSSDLRVGKMFDDMKASQEKANTGTKQADDVTFKKVQDRISAEIKTSVSQLYQSDQIDKATHDRLIGRKDNILKQADQHNRDLSQEDLDVLQSLPLEAPVKQGLIDAFRDLNTITNAAMKKNARGPIERAARMVLPVVATGATVSNPVAGIATLAAKGSVIHGARGLDNLLGLQQPEILRRIRVAQRRAKAGTPVGDTMHFLSDLGANAQAGVNVQTEAAAKESASQRLLRAKRRLQDNPGLNGFDRYIYDQTGLLPSEVDKGLLKLTSDGTITPAQQKAFYQSPNALKEGNQGNVIMDMLNDMAVKGDLKRNEGWQGLRPETLPTAQGGGTEGIRNIYAYRQAMANVADTTTTAQQSAPSAELRQAVNAIANAPTPQAKQALFAQIKAANPQHAQWLDNVVAPLTQFGPKNDTASEAAAPAPANVSGGGLGIRPSPIGTIPGAPSKLGPALAPEFRPAGSARLPEVPLNPKERIPVSDVAREEARIYKGRKKIATPELTEHLEPDEGYLRQVADYLENAKHDPNAPEVRKSYDALIKETVAQFKAIGKDLKVTPFKGEGEPYHNSREAMQDIVRNRHLYYFRTDVGFGEGADTSGHPLLEKTGIKDADGNELVANDVFRIVHDYFGHSQNGFQFGPKGEYNAFQEHARMYSPQAVPALAAETLAQNAWVNFGPHLRRPDGSIPQKGEPGFQSQKERRFADQKAFIVPWSVLARDPNPEGIANVLGLERQTERSRHSDRISTRNPKAVKALEDPTGADLQINTAAMKRTPEAFAHNTKLVKSYPGVKTKAKTPDRIAADFVSQVKDNLLWLFDQVPPDVRDRSKRWYEGANAISNHLAAEYALPQRVTAGVIAALSPQKDWYQNVSLAERVLDIYHNQADFHPDEKMHELARSDFGHAFPEMIGAVLSKPLRRQPDAAHKALWLRLYDEAHNPRSYNIITPEGEKGPLSSADVAWGSLSEIGKAIKLIEDGSFKNVSELMGGYHKVRNFYNNIVDPQSEKGDVTIDTHAVAAGLLRPLAGSHAEVYHNFGTSPEKAKQPKGWVATKSSSVTGARGLYGLYADAYRQAAAERGVLPREMQSITWEAIRGLFKPSLKKSKKMVQEIDSIWRQYQTGKLTLDEARRTISERAGGIEPPSWITGRDTGADEDL